MSIIVMRKCDIFYKNSPKSKIIVDERCKIYYFKNRKHALLRGAQIQKKG